MNKDLTPKEKAEELVDKFTFQRDEHEMFVAKQCALIAVENEYNAKIEAYHEMSEFCEDIAFQAIMYAGKEKEEVKQEIEKL